MTALGLAGSEDWGMGWFVETTAWETDLPAYFSLRFYLEDETGGMVELDWFYNDSDYADESWFGYWTIETVLDGPSYVTLSIDVYKRQIQQRAQNQPNGFVRVLYYPMDTFCKMR